MGGTSGKSQKYDAQNKGHKKGKFSFCFHAAVKLLSRFQRFLEYVSGSACPSKKETDAINIPSDPARDFFWVQHLLVIEKPAPQE